MSHAEYNNKYGCNCSHPDPERPEKLLMRPERLAKEKLQYVSFTYDFVQKNNVVLPNGIQDLLLNNLAMASAATILKFYQYKLDSASHGFTFDWAHVLDTFKRLYCNNISCKE